MKSKLLIMAALCAIAFTANAQTKGTNTLSLGFGVTSQEIDYNRGTDVSSSKNNTVSLGYGLFFKDNEKLGLNVSYGSSKQNNTNSEQKLKTYGANLGYQKYFPIVSKLFAFAGGQAGYTFGKQTSLNSGNSSFQLNEYSAGAFGGISWFASKRFAFETTILSAAMQYSKSKQAVMYSPNNPQYQQVENSAFGVSSQGSFNDLGFKIYFLF